MQDCSPRFTALASPVCIPAGLAADRRTDVGYRDVLVGLWSSCSFGHPGYWRSLQMALAVMGDAAWHPIATGYLVRRFPKRRAQVLGIHAMGGTVGAEVLAPLAAGAVLTIFDWRVALQVAVVPALVMGITFALLRHRLRPVAGEIGHKTDLAGLIGPWLRLSGLRLAAAMIPYNMSVIGMVSMLPLYPARMCRCRPWSWPSFCGYRSQALAASPVGALTDRHGHRSFSGLMLGGAAALCGAFAMLPLMDFRRLPPYRRSIAIAALTAIRSAFLASAVEWSTVVSLPLVGLHRTRRWVRSARYLPVWLERVTCPTPCVVWSSAWWQLSLPNEAMTAGP